MESVNDWIVMLATAAFAVSAVLAVADKGVDIFGCTVLGTITAIGGGTIRDLILDVPIFWAADLSFVWVAVAASLAGFFARSFFARGEVYGAVLYLDGFGAALFGIQATAKVWDLGFGLPAAPVILGVLTAIGGGLIRDVLAGRRNLLMSRELYATPVMCGSILFVLVLALLPEWRAIGFAACVAFTFGLRAAAIRWKLAIPEWLTTRPNDARAA